MSTLNLEIHHVVIHSQEIQDILTRSGNNPFVHSREIQDILVALSGYHPLVPLCRFCLAVYLAQNLSFSLAQCWERQTHQGSTAPLVERTPARQSLRSMERLLTGRVLLVRELRYTLIGVAVNHMMMHVEIAVHLKWRFTAECLCQYTCIARISTKQLLCQCLA